MLRRPTVAAQLFKLRHLFLHATRRQYTSTPPPASRVARIESRLPRFLQRFVTPLRNAPISHITAFVILHEITAIVPLFGLAAAFHYSQWLPPYISEGAWVSQGTEMFGRWLRRRGWITEEESSGRWWGRGEGGVRLVVELATAYAIVKALLPLRLILSIWATPWFARWTVLPLKTRLSGVFGKGKGVGSTSSPAAGTNAIGAGVAQQSVK